MKEYVCSTRGTQNHEEKGNGQRAREKKKEKKKEKEKEKSETSKESR